jgi:hypothetical protein
MTGLALQRSVGGSIGLLARVWAIKNPSSPDEVTKGLRVVWRRIVVLPGEPATR